MLVLGLQTLFFDAMQYFGDMGGYLTTTASSVEVRH
jgi:hypothetical protein